MARYNTISATGSVSGGNTITTPSSGLLTTLTGSGTVTIPNPVLYTGQTQTFYNSTGSAITLSTPSGNFVAPGFTSASTISVPAGSVITVVSDGANYQTQGWLGGTVSTPNLVATGGTIDGVVIGGTTKAAGSFNALTVTSGASSVASLSASGTVSLTNNASITVGTTGTGTLQVTGGASFTGGINAATDSYFGGKVGINIVNPQVPLHIKNGGASGTLSLSGIAANDTGGASYILMGNTDSGGTTGPSMIVAANRSTQIGVGTSFTSASGGTFTPYLTVNNLGYVGIGTTGPTEVLQVNGAIRSTTNAQNFQGTSGALFDYYSSQMRFAVYNGSSTGQMNLSTASTLSVNAVSTNYSWGQNRKSFAFGFTNSTLFFQIGYLPPSSAGTGDAIYIETTGITSTINGKGKLKVALGQRGGFWYTKAFDGGDPRVHVRVYQQADTSSQVWIYNSQNAYTSGEVLYYTYGWGAQNGFNQGGGGATIYDVTSSGQSSTPSGTLIFDSVTDSTYPSNDTPAFCVGGVASSTYSANNAIVFNSVFFDTRGNYSTSTGKFTAPVAGIYHFSVVVLVNGSSAGNQYDFVLNVSGNGFYGAPGRITYSSGSTSWGDGYIAFGNHVTYRMAAGDTAYCYFTTFGGGGIYSGTTWTRFSGHKVG